MQNQPAVLDKEVELSRGKLPWEEPAIVLERPLVVEAQEEDPFMGPLTGPP